jgi:hypothetical protein
MIVMMKRFCALSCLFVTAAISHAAVVWYGGDFDGRNGAPNEVNGLLSEAKTYDDFTLTSPTLVTGAWSNNLFDSFTATTAEIEIRTGVSTGNGGTVVFSGTFPATISNTGRSGFGMTERQVKVTGLSVALSPGTYHLSVTPVGGGSGRSFVSSTSGANSVGTPIANGNSFVNSAELAFNFANANYLGAGNWDFSMGIESGSGPASFGPTAINVLRGVLASGNLNSLQNSDNDRLVYRPGVVFSSGQAPISYELTATAPHTTTSELRFTVESHASAASIQQKIELFDYIANAYVPVDTRNLTTSDTTAEIIITTNPGRFVQGGTRQVKARLEFKATGAVFQYPWETRVDMAIWRQTP